MVKLRTVKDHNDKKIYTFYCPGCKHSHMFNNQWTFNGDMDSPTFSPSLLNYTTDKTQVCHIFVRDGKIEYLSDCTHELAGKIVEMEDVNA